LACFEIYRKEPLHPSIFILEETVHFANAPQIKRLVVFQNTCLLAKHHTHKLNKWMIRFLIEHALPIDDKVTNYLATDSTTITHDPPHDLSMLHVETQKLTDQGRFTNFALSRASI
jgi:hypothetical protein